ncbi:MAG: pyruvate kinase [Phycisphaerales bacterium]|nr:pyruvate kinase [Phycisphaerales bacterium]
MTTMGRETPVPTARLERLRRIAAQLDELLSAIENVERAAAVAIQSVPPEYRLSAVNLVRYLAIRNVDLRPLQMDLAVLGLSSLGRCEPHVRETIEAVRLTVAEMLGEPLDPSRFEHGPGLLQTETMLARRTVDLLGEVAHPGRETRIMVTMPSEAADVARGPELLARLCGAGMDIVRINCAHDTEADWLAMARHIADAAGPGGGRLRVLADIPGPKVRTGPITPGPAVARWRPRRDALGRPVAPALVALVAGDGEASLPPLAEGTTVLGMPATFLRALATGSMLRLRDTRAHRRRLRVVTRLGADAWLAEAWQTGYAAPGTKIWLQDEGNAAHEGVVEWTPRSEGSLLLHEGDALLVTPSGTGGIVEGQARVPCTFPDALGDVRTNDRVLFDDGKIGGVVERVSDEGLLVRITRARAGGATLRADKSMNFPDSPLRIPSMTEDDRAAMPFVAGHADMVGLSFVNSVEDVRVLAEALRGLGVAGKLGIVLKIETRRAFDNLPALILEAMRTPPVGVMIARGDLAVECGFERMAEVQEEILWMCEAAHVPVIWATQVLESLTKKGLPSRAEVTDAAMSERAECVMLNKGPFVVEAVRTLNDILGRMSSHQQKKMAMLRPLRVARGFGAGAS